MRASLLKEKILRYPRLAGIPDHVTDFFEIPSLEQYSDESVTWAVDGLIPRGSLTFLVAPPGGYKTWFALALAGAVSQGSEFLGRQTSRMPVCYLDRENSLAMMLQRRSILKLDDKCFLKFWGNWSATTWNRERSKSLLSQVSAKLMAENKRVADDDVPFETGRLFNYNVRGTEDKWSFSKLRKCQRKNFAGR